MSDMPEEIWCHPIWGGNFAFTLMRKAISKKDTRYIRAPQWQAIETAPRDGTRILLFNGCGVYEGKWLKENNDENWDKEIETWFITISGDPWYNQTLEDATHWMPLPQPPEEA